MPRVVSMDAGMCYAYFLFHFNINHSSCQLLKIALRWEESPYPRPCSLPRTSPPPMTCWCWIYRTSPLTQFGTTLKAISAPKHSTKWAEIFIVTASRFHFSLPSPVLPPSLPMVLIPNTFPNKFPAHKSPFQSLSQYPNLYHRMRH